MNPIRRSILVMALTGAVLAAPASSAATAAAPQADARLVAVGSLGGRESWGDVMNAAGDIAGGSMDDAGNWRAALWRHGRWSATDLGVGSATPMAMNDRGHVVGTVHREENLLFLWRAGTVTYLRPGVSLEVAAVNDHDQIVGTAYRPDGTRGAFLWHRGRLTMLPVPTGVDSTAVDINDHAQIVGTVAGPDGDRAVLWQRGRMTTLGTLGGATSTPIAINDRGQVIGNSAVTGSPAEHPFRWQHGRMTDLLAQTTATGGRVYALSGTGLMTGSATWADGRSRPVLWRDGRLIDIGLPGHTGIGTAVNDRGEVAGLSWAQPTDVGAVPFRWRDGSTTLFPEPVADISIHVVGIDRRGTVGVSAETTSPGLQLLRSDPSAR